MAHHRVRRESTSELVHAPGRIAVMAGAEVVRIDNAIAQLRSLGVRIQEYSRLHQARAVLEAAASGGGVTPAQRGDDLGLRAFETSLDYHAIASILQPPLSATVKRELRDSLVGELNPPYSRRGPLQRQSQSVAFSAFALAGCSPYFPPKTKGKSPDIFLDNGIGTYAVEVKRPQERHNVLRLFREANEQLEASGLSGGVVIDASDCVRGLVGEAFHEAVESIGFELLVEAGDPVWGRKTEYARVIMIGCVARTTEVHRETAKEAILDFISSGRMVALARVRNSLEDHRARWLRSSHEAGMKAIFGPLGDPAGKGAT